ncbi:MAG: DUF4292 domain-containing protein [Chitinophagaceae bacterium]|nr:DUF4292 domain-containing protein [Chitinophagaceae bacterium]
MKYLTKGLSSGWIFFFTILMIVFFDSCKSAKTIQAAISKKDTTALMIAGTSKEDSLNIIKDAIAVVHKKHTDFKTFSAKIKVEYQDSKGKQPGITAFVRMIKDSVIWISGYATVFNIEAFRAKITMDSVFVIDKINKEVQMRSIDYLQEVTQIPFDFKTLQDLLLGNPIFFTDSVVSYKETESKILLSTVGVDFKHLLTLNKPGNSIVHSKLDDLDINRNRTADITYDEFEEHNGISFSTYREITVSEKNKLDIELKFKQYEFDKELQVNFNIPKNYKRR